MYDYNAWFVKCLVLRKFLNAVVSYCHHFLQTIPLCFAWNIITADIEDISNIKQEENKRKEAKAELDQAQTYPFYFNPHTHSHTHAQKLLTKYVEF